MTFDDYFDRVYNSEHYNCAHFVCEVWKDETSQDISVNLQGFLRAPKERKALLPQLRAFKRILQPQSPCIVLFQALREAPHVGIYLRGRVLHISSKQGVRFDLLECASIGAKKIGFFVC